MKYETTKIKDNTEIQNIIISQIKDFINLKNLELGDKLPSQRVLSEKFNVSRRHVGEAIEKLEFYGVLKSVPQSGTFVENIGHIALNGIIEDIIALEKQDFKSLVETRLMLETKTACLATIRRTEEDLENIETALNNYKVKVLNREDALEEDLLFHLAIAKASGNSTINALMLQITPKIISVLEDTRVCGADERLKELQNHEAIYHAIKIQDTELAVKVMKVHFEMLIAFCNNFEK
ncbi:transcriptional regulator, GntR family [Formosa agariphila KMM 3901]|uniref:Transcriptional regulator, GntR family n=1 Tax=Formosa agariphila (strain DSM 15362 / KCTC 12365 / LMG 23005 / KMM 3901 / M-2Alg 35-1) TaxID=1347342 RepID=T2KJS0_FORAG|nr:FCD domain-containing protein [Formosa agariphila]CDF78666.1 transcriptional regulator, GntR family [Formosa agariphila KMM 3901]